VSFHIPLHRYLAAFTCQAVRAQGIPLKDILPSNSLLELIMMHPLRIQVSVFLFILSIFICEYLAKCKGRLVYSNFFLHTSRRRKQTINYYKTRIVIVK